MSQQDDQRQRQLRDAYDLHQQQIDTAAARILEERGADLEKQAAMRNLDVIPDPQLHKEAAAEMAQELAERGVRSGNFSICDYRDVADLGIERAQQARADREQEAASPEQPSAPEQAGPIGEPPEASGPRIEEPGSLRLPNYASLRQEHAQAEIQTPGAPDNDLRGIDPASSSPNGPDGGSEIESSLAPSSASLPPPAIAAAWDAWEARVERNETSEHGGEQNSAAGFLAMIAATSSHEKQSTAEPSMMDLMKDQPGQEREPEPSGLMADFVTAETSQEVENAITQAHVQPQHANSGHTM